MARLFSTQFPLRSKTSLDDFLEVTKIWISGSPHNPFSNKELANLKSHGESIRRNDHAIELFRSQDGGYSGAGVKYIHPSHHDSAYISSVVGYKDEKGFIAAVNVDYESSKIRNIIPEIKKPYLIKLLINRLGGGMDGNLRVTDKPFTIDESEEGIEIFISDMFTGKGNFMMPLIYVSAKEDSSYLLNPNSLAHNVSGMAHVLVEPSRKFSYRLRDKLKGYNAFKGAIGIYWPDGQGRYILVDKGEDPKTVEEEIYQTITTALQNKRIPRKLTLDHISSAHNLAIIRRITEGNRNIQESHNRELNDVFNMYATELDTKENALREHEARINQLESKLRALDFKENSEGTVLVQPSIVPFYDGEVTGILIDTLQREVATLPKNSRRYEILNQIIQLNPVTGERERLLDSIERILKGYTGMTSKIRGELKSLGIGVKDDGRHYRLFMEGNPSGIGISLSKTPSDYRTAMNQLRDIKRTMF